MVLCFVPVKGDVLTLSVFWAMYICNRGLQIMRMDDLLSERFKKHVAIVVWWLGS